MKFIGSSLIDWASWVAAINVCEEAVALDAGGTESRYTCNGVINTSNTHKINIKKILTSMAGELMFQNGKWFLYAGEARTAVKSRNADHFIGTVAYEAKKSLSDKTNGVRGDFYDASSGYQLQPYPTYQNATYLANDGGQEQFLEVSFPMTSSVTMAQRLAKISLGRSRMERKVSLTTNLIGLQDKAGDIVTVDYPRLNIVALEMKIEKWSLQVSSDRHGNKGLVVAQTYLEEDSTIYDWASAEEGTIAPPGTLNHPDKTLLDFGDLGGSTKPEDNATDGATWNENISDIPIELHNQEEQNEQLLWTMINTDVDTRNLNKLMGYAREEVTSKITDDWEKSETSRTVLQTNIDTTTASIITEESVRVSEDAALASSITSLSTTVGTNTTNVSTNISSIDGIQGKYAVKIDNNGAVIDSGVVYMNSAFIQDAAITTAKIGFLQVTTAEIANLTVGTNKITADAVTESISSYTSAYLTVNSGTSTRVVLRQVSIDVTDMKEVYLNFTAGVSPVSTDQKLRFEYWRDTTMINEFETSGFQSLSNYVSTSVAYTDDVSAISGTVIYYMKCRETINGNGGLVAYRSLVAIGLKK